MRDKAKTVSKELVSVVTVTEQQIFGEEASVGGRIKTDMGRKKNREGDVLERQKCEHRGRAIRRDKERLVGAGEDEMRKRVVSEWNAIDKEGRRGEGKKTGEQRD